MNIKDIKEYFFAFRNGIIADTLRKGGIPHKYIFGLTLPQINNLANQISENRHSLAGELWRDNECRESRILACCLFDPKLLDHEKTLTLIKEVKTREEADILAFKVLKFAPFSSDLLEYSITDNALATYTLEALKRNLM